MNRQKSNRNEAMNRQKSSRSVTSRNDASMNRQRSNRSVVGREEAKELFELRKMERSMDDLEQKRPLPSVSNQRISLRILSRGHNCCLSLDREVVPKQLFRAGVDKEEWQQIWDSVAMDWAPMLSTATAGVDIVACNALALASFLLRARGILVQIKMGLGDGRDDKSIVPIGLEFFLEETKSRRRSSRKPIMPRPSRTETLLVASSGPSDGPTTYRQEGAFAYLPKFEAGELRYSNAVDC